MLAANADTVYSTPRLALTSGAATGIALVMNTVADRSERGVEVSAKLV